jgi:hypothetical protein
MPSLNPRLPSPGITYIKGVLNEEGVDSTCFDLNHHFYNEFGEDSVVWCEGHAELKEEYREYLFEYAEQLRDYDWIGLSLFSFNSQISTGLFLEIIKEKGITGQIVLGGNGLVNSGGSIEIFGDRTYANFGERMVEQGLAHYYIMGEGDKALPALLRGEAYTFPQMANIQGLPYPDYSDIDLSTYEWKNMITITGSRGCVRNCTFCDINLIWPKYRFRPGKEIAEEMAHQYKKYGADMFYFSDSLVNGSLKEFRVFCKTLAEMNLPIKWFGQAIFRSGMTDEDWDNVRDSGCEYMAIGIESGSEQVRWHMKKKFDNRALYSSIKACGERGIRLLYLLIAGYPTETEEDHQETIKMLRKSAPYAEHIEVRCSIGYLMEGTEMKETTEWFGDHIENWQVKLEDDTVLDLERRIHRWAEIHITAKELGMRRDQRIEQIKREHIRKLKQFNGSQETINLVESV